MHTPSPLRTNQVPNPLGIPGGVKRPRDSARPVPSNYLDLWQQMNLAPADCYAWKHAAAGLDSFRAERGAAAHTARRAHATEAPVPAWLPTEAAGPVFRIPLGPPSSPWRDEPVAFPVAIRHGVAGRRSKPSTAGAA